MCFYSEIFVVCKRMFLVDIRSDWNMVILKSCYDVMSRFNEKICLDYLYNRFLIFFE